MRSIRSWWPAFFIMAMPVYMHAQISEQPRWYATAGLGGNISMFNAYHTAYEGSTVTTTPAAYGSGYHAGIAAGYQYLPALGFELGAAYNTGIPDKFKFDDQYSRTYTTGSVLYCASAVFSLPLGPVKVYLKTGFEAGPGWVDVKANDRAYNPSYPNGTNESISTLFNGYTIGSHSTIGCEYKIPSKPFSVFFETSFQSLALVPLSGKTYAYSLDGKDMLSSLSEINKNVVYVNKVSLADYYAAGDPNKPARQLTGSLPVSAFSLTAGIKMALGKSTIETFSPENERYMYARLQAGFGFPVNADHLIYTPDDSTFSSKTVSQGAGANFAIGAGYMFNSSFGVDLGFNYAAGQSVTGSNMPPQPGYIQTVIYSGNMWEAIPSVVFTADAGILQPYARLGAILGMGTLYRFEEISTPQYGDLKSDETFSGGLSFGYQGVIGIAYPMNEKLSLFAECDLNSIFFTPDKSMVTRETYNETDITGSLSAADRYTLYKFKFDASAQTSDKPYQTAPSKYSYSAAVISAGIKIQFGKR